MNTTTDTPKAERHHVDLTGGFGEEAFFVTRAMHHSGRGKVRLADHDGDSVNAEATPAELDAMIAALVRVRDDLLGLAEKS